MSLNDSSYVHIYNYQIYIPLLCLYKTLSKYYALIIYKYLYLYLHWNIKSVDKNTVNTVNEHNIYNTTGLSNIDHRHMCIKV